MAKFGAKAVERPEYDFTEIPRPDGNGMCKGKGFIPGHTKAEWEAYQDEITRIQKDTLKLQQKARKGLPKDFDPAKATVEENLKVAESVDKAGADKLANEFFEATVKACKGHPSRQELEELPYEYLMSFYAFVAVEISQPKSTSGSTPQQAATNGDSTMRSNVT